MALSWKQVQRNERAFWESIYLDRKPDIDNYTPITDEKALDFTHKSLQRFGHSLEHLSGRVVADVGCGPYGLVAGLDVHVRGHGGAPARFYAVDPLMDTYRTFGTLPARPYVELVTSRGESMPLPGETCDLIYSTNVVDHVEDPEQFIRDCHRVCKTGGEFLFAVHTVKPRFAILRPVLFIVDRNHPHHFVRSRLERMVTAHFTTVEVTSIVGMIDDQPDFTFRNIFRAKERVRALRRWASTVLIETLYFRCRK